MTLTKQQQESLLEAAKPLIKWMNENCHPHCIAHIDRTSVEVVEGVLRLETLEFVKD